MNPKGEKGCLCGDLGDVVPVGWFRGGEGKAAGPQRFATGMKAENVVLPLYRWSAP
jgi:hypothetical protein